jgi:hypothetical protein
VGESAAVTVSTYPTGNGLRLKLTSKRSGEEVLLDATVLEALCHVRATGSPNRSTWSARYHRGLMKALLRQVSVRLAPNGSSDD